MPLTERMKLCRINNKETQTETAEALGIVQQHYSKYETGKMEINVRYLKKLCEHWNVTADYLLGLTDIPYTLDSRK